MTATIMTSIAATTGTTRFKLAMKIFIGSSSLPPPFTSGSSRAGAMVPGTENVSATVQSSHHWHRLRGAVVHRCADDHRPYLPPVTVKVANSYSATAKPALLWAVTRKWYQLAGSRSNTTKLPPGLTLFETWFHSCCSLKNAKRDF